MAKRVKDLAVVTGSYFKDGLEKRRYQRCGVLMEGDDGNQFIMLNRYINFAGLPFKDGSESIVVSLFDPDNGERKQQNQQASQQQSSGSAGGGNAGAGFGDDLDDDVPF